MTEILLVVACFILILIFVGVCVACSKLISVNNRLLWDRPMANSSYRRPKIILIGPPMEGIFKDGEFQEGYYVVPDPAEADKIREFHIPQ